MQKSVLKHLIVPQHLNALNTKCTVTKLFRKVTTLMMKKVWLTVQEIYAADFTAEQFPERLAK
jgi:uncharacterized Fe-S radical SAM superfamily protein PflX